MNGKIKLSVFTKPWRDLSVTELGKFVSGLGFDGIEFPLRPGYQVEPERAEKELPVLVHNLSEYGLKVFSVASNTDERIFAACAESGIPIIRIMADIRDGQYMQSIHNLQKQLEDLQPLCVKYGVKVGVQQHYGNGIIDAMGLRYLLERSNPTYFGAIWDSAHDGLTGQSPEFGLDTVWPQLCMVNFKNAHYVRKNSLEGEQAEWSRYFTTGQEGMASWKRAVEYLKSREYEGVICLTAEYSEEHEVNKFIRQDAAYVRSLIS